MNPTKFARDVSGASIGLPHWQWGSRRSMAVGAASARAPEALNGHLVFIETTTPCHVRLGSTTVEAMTNDPVLKPGVVYVLPRARGEDYVAVRAVAGEPDGTLDFWQADRFVEA